MPRPTLRSAPLLGLALLGLGACASSQPMVAVNPNPPIPALPAETVPLPPVSAAALTWQPAHYDWTGTFYRLVSGTYVPAEGHQAWAPAWWSLQNGAWVWMPAHWAG